MALHRTTLLAWTPPSSHVENYTDSCDDRATRIGYVVDFRASGVCGRFGLVVVRADVEDVQITWASLTLDGMPRTRSELAYSKRRALPLRTNV